MLTAEAHIQTSRPSRYLIQLCKHANDMGQHRRRGLRAHPGNNTPERPQIQHAEWSDTFGTLRLNWGECTIQANPDTLTLRAQAADQENLQRIQELITERLEKFGRRDRLKVNWQQPRNASQPSGRQPRSQLCPLPGSAQLANLPGAAHPPTAGQV